MGLSFIFQGCGFPYFAKDVYNCISKGIDMQEVRNLAKEVVNVLLWHLI